MGMESCSGAPMPMVAVNGIEDPEFDPELAKRYRTSTCLSRELLKPRVSSIKNSKRVESLLTCLAGICEVYNFFPAENGTKALAWTDSNWAACRKSRKSALQIGGCMLFSYSRTQAVIADGSAVAEWYAIATATAETMFFFSKEC
eukprot:666953-Amphidinium_carterae.1